MDRRVFLGSLLALGAAAPANRRARRPARIPPMHDAARAFLASLESEKRSKAALAFDDEERFNWHFVPRERQGLALKEMTEAQREKAMALLRSSLSAPGYEKTTGIIALEDVLAVIEGGRGPMRDREFFYFTVFGEPAPKTTWGWRIEGHHISLNFTLVQGTMIASTPQFLGANPAEVRDGPQKGKRALRAEEDLGRELVKSLSAEQKKTAVIATEAPADIITGASRRAELLTPKGLAYSAMTETQRGLVMALLNEYAGAMRGEIARDRMEKLRAAGLPEIHFAWAGGFERGQGHYYRLQGPTFLVEYDNTQNGANHIHTVWRDFKGDWGEDLLARHYHRSSAAHDDH
jgi:hypothetical protein